MVRGRRQGGLTIACAIAMCFSAGQSARAYDFWRPTAGRQQRETKGYYDLDGRAWDDSTFGLNDAFKFDWSIQFPKAGTNYEGPFVNAGVRDSWEEAASGVITEWAKWANISLGTKKTNPVDAQIRFSFHIDGTAISVPGFGTDPLTYADIKFDKLKAAYWDNNAYNAASKPVTSQIRYSALHEFGHALGLHDLYKNFTEEFVDHQVAPATGSSAPNRDEQSRRDNIMQGAQAPGKEGAGHPSDYPHKPVIDNDEIAGVTWLWGGPYNQIVTGELANAWNTGLGRNTPEHHGDEAGHKKKWDYRGSVVSETAGKKPYVDIEFPGYQNIVDKNTYGSTTPDIKYGGNQGVSIERFIIDEAGWTGNFTLTLESQFDQERRVRAWVSGGQTDNFVLPINTNGLVYDGDDSWPVVFGPTGSERMDYGDAPDSYKTLLASDGPRYKEDKDDKGNHLQTLGRRWDGEPDGQPTPGAIGDDVNLWGIGGSDDEDGVIFGDNWVDIVLNVLRPGVNDYLLRGWGDFDLSSVFEHPKEMFIDKLLSLAPGEHPFRFPLPDNPDYCLDTYYRFRLTWMDDPLGWKEGFTGSTTKDIKPWGEYLSLKDGLSHGEVEDYWVPEPASVAVWAVLGCIAVASGWRRRKKRP